jgi:phage/plasmid primase-like uncharacterized protein
MLNLTRGGAARHRSIEELDRRLRDRIEDLVCELRSAQPNPKLSTKAELRFGSKGSLAVTVAGRERGRITDFEGDGKGKTPLQFIRDERGVSFENAVLFAKEWLGEPDTTARRRPRAAEGVPKHASSVDDVSRAAKVKQIIGESGDPSGTDAERYLRRRGITAPLPSVIRYRASAHGVFGAVVAVATNPVGEPQAVQQIYVTGDGEKAPLEIKKRTNGPMAGCAVKLPGSSSAVILAEGPETALSIWQATGAEVWAVLGASNFARCSPPAGRPVLIAADGDRPDSPAAKSLRAQASMLAQAGFTVSVARPIQSYPDVAKTDFNDVLLRDGEQAIRDAIDAAEPWRLPGDEEADTSNVTPSLPPFYPDAEEDPVVALARMRATIGAYFDGELLRLAAAREAETEAARRHTAAGLDLDPVDLAMLDESAIRQNRAAKARITRQVRRAVRAKYRIRHLHKGRREQLPSPAGAGKTRTTIEAILARPGLWNFVIYFMVPELAMAEQVAATFAELAAAQGRGPTVRIVRGMGAPLPEGDPDDRMCGRFDVVTQVIACGLRVGPNLCESGDKRCRLFDECAYQAQRRSGPGIYIMAHDLLALPAPAPKPDLLVVDESHHARLLGEIQFPLERIEAVGSEVYLSGQVGAAAANDYAVAAQRIRSAMMQEVRDAQRAGREPYLLEAVRRAGFTSRKEIEQIAAVLARIDSEVKPDFNPTSDDAAVLVALSRYAATEIAAVKRFFRRISSEIEKPRRQAIGIVLDPDGEIKLKGRTMRTAVLRVHDIRRIHVGTEIGALILDASANFEINSRIWGARLENVPARIRRRAHVIQVYGPAFSRQSITGCDGGGRPLSDEKLSAAQRLQGEIVSFLNDLSGTVAVFTNRPVEELIAPWLRAGVRVGHYGAIRGKNAWEDCDTIVVIGREQPRAWAMEAAARSLYGDDDEPLLLTGDYVEQTRGVRSAGGAPVTATIHVHPDLRVQALLEASREREVEQAIDRGRLIHNALPKTVYILNDLPLDIDVDRFVSWTELRAGGTVFERAWNATGVLPAGAADLHRAHPTLFPTQKAAERALEKSPIKYPPTPNHITVGDRGVFSCRYRRSGQRGKLSTAFVCATRHPEPRLALEAVLGTLVEFDLIHQGDREPRPANEERRFVRHAIRDATGNSASPKRALVIRCGIQAPAIGLDEFFTPSLRPSSPIEVPPGVRISRPTARLYSVDIALDLPAPAPPAEGARPRLAPTPAPALASYDDEFDDDLDPWVPEDRIEAARRWLHRCWSARRVSTPNLPSDAKDARYG